MPNRHERRRLGRERPVQLSAITTRDQLHDAFDGVLNRVSQIELGPPDAAAVLMTLLISLHMSLGGSLTSLENVLTASWTYYEQTMEQRERAVSHGELGDINALLASAVARARTFELSLPLFLTAVVNAWEVGNKGWKESEESTRCVEKLGSGLPQLSAETVGLHQAVWADIMAACTRKLTEAILFAHTEKGVDSP